MDLDLDLDQHFRDLAPEADLANDLERAPAPPPARPTSTLTNSPGCSPAPNAFARLTDRAPLRRVRSVASSVPASACWARPSRTLRKVARRAVDHDRLEPA
ncbi:MAG: hypothetical protein R3F35_05125 [Myxococcota bacterium]